MTNQRPASTACSCSGRELWWAPYDHQDECPDHLPIEAVEAASADTHACKPDATVYYCPTAGATESDCHGGVRHLLRQTRAARG